MKHLKITTGLFLALAATLFFATGCSKNNAPQQQQQNQPVAKPAGIAFTKWFVDSRGHGHIVFLPKDSIQANATAYFTALNAYNKSVNIAELTTSQTQSFNGVTLKPTISVFNYPNNTIEDGMMMHVRAYRYSESLPNNPTFTSTPTATGPLGLVTFTTASPVRTFSSINDGRVGGTTVPTPPKQYDFATRLEMFSSAPDHTDYWIDAWLLNSTSVTSLSTYSNTPAIGSFTDPKNTPAQKYVNYWRLYDATTGHESRVCVTLEEP